MPIPYYTDLDLNGNRTRDAADAVLPQDYVTLAQMTAFVNGFSATFGDGVATTFNIVHSLNSEDLVTKIREVASGDTVEMGVSTNGVNAVDITANPAPTAGQFRITIVPRA